MKKILLIISILVICISISTFGQKNIDDRHIKASLGLGGNYIKDNLNTNSIYGDPNIKMDPSFGIGYYFSSEFDIPIYKQLSLKTGVNFSLYNHTSTVNFRDSVNQVFNNEKITYYQSAIEIPLMLTYKLLKFKDNYFSINAGIKYTSYIYYTNGIGLKYNNSYEFTINASPDLNIGDGDSFKNMNLSSILGISFSKKLNNNNYINIDFTYNVFAIRPTIAEYKMINQDGYLIGGGKIQGYYQGFSLGLSYTFSFQKNYDEIYKKGYNEGLKHQKNKSDFIKYASNTRAIKCKFYIKNGIAHHRIKSKVINYKVKNNGSYKRQRADIISANYIGTTYLFNTCGSNAVSVNLPNTLHNRKKSVCKIINQWGREDNDAVRVLNSEITAYFYTEDNGGSISSSLTLEP